MTLKIAIVDDDEMFRQKIETTIRDNMQGKLFLKTYSRPYNLLEDDVTRFDIYILDIEMPGMNGVELSHRIRQRDKRGEIIFLTSFQKYAIQGYTARAYAYLMKEKMEEELMPVIKKLESSARERSQKIYMIETSSSLEKMIFDEIIYIYKDKKNCVFVTENGEKMQRVSLENVYQTINSDEFVYVDKGKIANIHHVKKVIKETLHMSNGDEIVISRSNIKKVKDAVKMYWSGQM